MKRQVIFQDDAFESFTDWTRLNPKLYAKIVALIKDIDRVPFKGLGKPEPLKNELSGYWS
jgi:toxin YoeB